MSQYIYLFRHGQTDANLIPEKKLLPAEPLNETGKHQAKQIGRVLAKERTLPEKIFSSELLRAQQTATIVADSLQIPIEMNPLLNEFNFGIYIGQTIANAEIYKEFATRKEKFYFTLPQGESDADVAQRAKKLIDHIKTLPYSLAICTHNYSTFVLKQLLLGKHINDLFTIPFLDIPQGEYITFVKTANGYKLVGK